MPKKERPLPLSERIFNSRLQNSPVGAVNGEIPVINTFIQFGDPSANEQDDKSLSTAPAWIGPSLQSIMQSAVEAQPSIQEDLSPSKRGGSGEDATLTKATPERGEHDVVESSMDGPGALQVTGQSSASVAALSELPSPKKVPVAQYALTASAQPVSVPDDGRAVTGDHNQGQMRHEAEADVSNDDQLGEEHFKRGPPEVDERAFALAESGAIPSVGSMKHDEGLCKRCCFFPKGRCLNGNTCEFCHYEHEKRKRKKKKKNKSGEGAVGDASDSEEGEPEVVTGIAGGDDGGRSGTLRAGKLPLTAPPPEPPRLPPPVLPQALHAAAQPWETYDPMRLGYDMAHQFPMPPPFGSPYDMGFGAPPYMPPEYSVYPPSAGPWPSPPALPVTSAVTSGYAPVVSQNGLPLPPPR